ncbi:UNVERIFIED_CONTAM: hypothetical protein Cloal_1224 [Acetivibrio alkalicellulosi]
MANSKKDFNIVLKIFIDFINTLTEDQFSNLVNGSADIKYQDKGLDNDKKEIYTNILYKIAIEDNIEEKTKIIACSEELSTKSKLLEFCKYFKICYKSKDTIDIIIKNIIEFIDKNKESIIYKYSMAENLEENIDKIAQRLEEIMDIVEARSFMSKSKILENKSNLLKLSKKLNVFIDRDSTREIIVDNIIRSVVEAKIRSYTIRKKI